MIDIQNVGKRFGKDTVLDDVTIHVPPGQIYGFIGENGAGKTTLIRCLTGIYKPDAGKIFIDGEEVYDNPKVKKFIGYVADGNQFFPYETIRGLIKFFKGMYENFSEDRFDELNIQFHLDKNKRIIQLSKGMQMRLAFMMALSIRPKVLVLDEPTSGLDAIAKNALLQMLIEEVEQNNTSVFISTHHLSELEKICDRMSIVQNGRLIYQTDMEELKSHIRKYQVVFKDTYEQPFPAEKYDRILHSEKIGSIHYFIADNTDGAFVKMMQEEDAYIIEELELSLEEIFIHTSIRNENGR